MESKLKLKYAGLPYEAELCENETAVDIFNGGQAHLITNRVLNEGEKFTVKCNQADLEVLLFGVYEPKIPENPLG